MVREKILKEFGNADFLTQEELSYINNFASQENRPVLILDFGSQLTPLIFRTMRELQVYAVLKNCNLSLAEIEKLNPIAIILSGGPESVYEEGSPTIDKAIFELGLPILGICYGQQLIANIMGGSVINCGRREFGKSILEIVKDSPLLEGVENNQVWMSHGDTINKMPIDFECVARTDGADFAVIANEKKKIYGMQYHPESDNTVDGRRMIENFIFKIVGAFKNPSKTNYGRMYCS